MIATNALDGFNAAEEALRKGNFEEALTGYLAVMRGVPTHWRSRFRIADCLLSMNAAHHSFAIYKALAMHAVKVGHPLWGLVAIKMAAAMDKAQQDLVHVVAALYSRSSDRIDPNLGFSARRTLKKSDPIGDPGFGSGQKLVDTAGVEAADTSAIDAFPKKLPPIPLFSFLEEDAFGEVMEGMQLRRFVKGQKIIEEGKQGESFFILAEGDVAVTRQVGPKTLNLARLHYGAVFGEMALIKKAPRTATVSALTDCDLLELSRSFLEAETRKLESVTQALHDFTHQRFLANLAATSAIFKPFPRSVRAEILNRFEDLEADPGRVLIREGDEGQGLYLILKGHVDVTKRGDDGAEIELATLKEGDIFGEISLIQSSPTTATCKAKTRATLLFLPKKSFNSTMARHPELKEELSKITTDRIQQQRTSLTDAEADDFILIEDDDIIML